MLFNDKKNNQRFNFMTQHASLAYTTLQIHHTARVTVELTVFLC